MSRIGAMITFAVFAALHAPLSVAAEEFAPYGTAKVKSQQYPPLKYVVESSAFDPSDVTNTLRVARQMLSLSPKGSQMTVVVIGGAIRAFAKENYEKYRGIVDLAAELRDAGVRIAFCGSSLLGAGYAPNDFHGIGEVVPGGYVEIAELASKGYAHIAPPAVLRMTRDARYVDQPQLKK